MHAAKSGRRLYFRAFRNVRNRTSLDNDPNGVRGSPPNTIIQTQTRRGRKPPNLSETSNNTSRETPSQHAPTSRHTRVRDVLPPCRSDAVNNAPAHTTTLYVKEGDTFCEAPADQILGQARAVIDRQFHIGCLVLDGPHRTRLFLKIHLGARCSMS